MGFGIHNPRRALLALLALLGACGPRSEPAPPAPRVVRAEAVYQSGGERLRVFAGVARASFESQLSFKVAGTVRRVYVRVGDQLKAADPVAELESTDYQLQVENARANLLRQEASARSASTTYARVTALYENNNASLAELEAARANDESARAAVESAQKSLELAQTQLSYTSLAAPVAGAISAVAVEAGENVGAGTPVAILTAGSRIEVEVSIPESLIGGVQSGQSVSVHFDAAGDRDFAATVIDVGVAASTGGSAFPVVARLVDETDAVLPGMAAEVEFRFQQTGGREAILVPPTAIGEDVDGRYCFVVQVSEDGAARVARTGVTVGDLTQEGIEILSGLDDGDVVVTAGVALLVDGETVRIWSPAGASR